MGMSTQIFVFDVAIQLMLYYLHTNTVLTCLFGYSSCIQWRQTSGSLLSHHLLTLFTPVLTMWWYLKKKSDGRCSSIKFSRRRLQGQEAVWRQRAELKAEMCRQYGCYCRLVDSSRHTSCTLSSLFFSYKLKCQNPWPTDTQYKLQRTFQTTLNSCRGVMHFGECVCKCTSIICNSHRILMIWAFYMSISVVLHKVMQVFE